MAGKICLVYVNMQIIYRWTSIRWAILPSSDKRTYVTNFHFLIFFEKSFENDQIEICMVFTWWSRDRNSVFFWLWNVSPCKISIFDWQKNVSDKMLYSLERMLHNLYKNHIRPFCQTHNLKWNIFFRTYVTLVLYL